jgi:hypothetical protein
MAWAIAAVRAVRSHCQLEQSQSAGLLNQSFFHGRAKLLEPCRCGKAARKPLPKRKLSIRHAQAERLQLSGNQLNYCFHLFLPTV